jgi:hypothetical protein
LFFFPLSELHNDSHQSAYKANFSTETVICTLVNNLLWKMEQNAVTIMVAVDLSSAFDSVDHDILVNILCDNIGVSGSVLEWSKSYLKNR